MSAICQCGQMGGVTHSCISPSYSGQTAPLYTKKIISQSGGTMNTHKEELSNCCSAKPCGEIAYDNSGRCGDCKEGCMFTEECDTSCGINADPADGFGKCTCGAELVEPTPPSQIEEESQTQRSLREMYELGKEHGRTLALKDMEIEKLIKETEELL